MTKRKKYSKEFKLDAITLVVKQNYSQAEASINLGVNPNMLGRWIKEANNEDGHAFRGNGKSTPEQAISHEYCALITLMISALLSMS
jgi:transposase